MIFLTLFRLIKSLIVIFSLLLTTIYPTYPINDLAKVKTLTSMQEEHSFASESANEVSFG